MRKSKLSLDINITNAYDEVSVWEHSSLGPDAPTDKRETRLFATNWTSILTLRPHNSSSCVNTHSGEPRTVSADRHNQRMYSIIPQTHHTMDSTIASSSRPQRSVMNICSNNLEAQPRPSGQEFRYSGQSPGSTTSQSTITNESRFPNGSGAIVKLSKKELKALEKKGRSQREVSEMNVR